jgi:ABC-2 type transport system permease protein
MKQWWNTLRCAAWLGWQIESNWASPWLFLAFVFIKPLAGSLMLVCMYWAVQAATASGAPPHYLPFLYVSTACFLVMGGLAFGMTNAIVSDRDNYGMLKYIRISPVAFRSFLLGRGLSRAAQAGIGALLSVAMGLALFPELRRALDPSHIAWAWLVFYAACGLVMLASLGLLLSGIVMNMSRYGMFLSEGISGALYLFCGAAFPINVLPPWLRPLSLALPPTYWLESMRRALLGTSDTYLGGWSHPELAAAVVGSTAALMIVADVSFRWNERRAWRRGRYDECVGI